MSDSGMSLSEHITELRVRLKAFFYFFVVVLIIVVFFPADPMQSVRDPGQYLGLGFLTNTIIAAFLRRIVHDILPSTWQLIAANGIGEGMEVYFVAAIIVSLAISMPVLAYETYKYIDPALKESERKLVYPFVASSTTLFVVGLLFGYFIIAKVLVLSLAPFFTATQTAFYVDSAAFYYITFLIVGATGVAFTAPVFIYSLISLRVLQASFVSRNRVVIWFMLWVVTGLFLTPDGGPLLDLVLFVPIVTLVELAAWLGGRRVKNSSGKEPPVQLNPADTCRYCGAARVKGHPFCPKCGKLGV